MALAMKKKWVSKFVFAGVFGFLFSVVGYAEDSPTAREIVQHCDYKDAGEDQRTTLTVILRDKDKNEKKSVYARLWKDFEGKDKIADKMILFTEFPPDAKGTAFVRWGFVKNKGKNADQWVYLPVTRTIRRVTIRDPGESFLGSDLTHADISGWGIDEDEHTLLKTAKLKSGQTGYIIEHKPKENDPLYSKRVSWYMRPASGDWGQCSKIKLDYYDKKGHLLKKQTIKWQQVDGAWLWKSVHVENVQTFHVSEFEVSKPEVDVGLKDNLFVDRTLKKGYRP